MADQTQATPSVKGEQFLAEYTGKKQEVRKKLGSYYQEPIFVGSETGAEQIVAPNKPTLRDRLEHEITNLNSEIEQVSQDLANKQHRQTALQRAVELCESDSFAMNEVAQVIAVNLMPTRRAGRRRSQVKGKHIPAWHLVAKAMQNYGPLSTPQILQKLADDYGWQGNRSMINNALYGSLKFKQRGRGQGSTWQYIGERIDQEQEQVSKPALAQTEAVGSSNHIVEALRINGRLTRVELAKTLERDFGWRPGAIHRIDGRLYSGKLPIKRIGPDKDHSFVTFEAKGA